VGEVGRSPGEFHRELRELVLNLNLEGLILTDLVVELLALLAKVIDTWELGAGSANSSGSSNSGVESCSTSVG